MTAYRNSWGNFREKNLSEYDEEAIKLYRNRDLDLPEYKRKTFTEIECKEGKYFKFYTNLTNSNLYYRPTDPKYYLLTEHEKLENGLMTKYDLLIRTPLALFVGAVIGTFAASQYTKIYSPGGIILRTENKVSTFNWFIYRAPITACFFAVIWFKYHLYLNKFIDFYSTNEDELDKKLFEISGKKV